MPSFSGISVTRMVSSTVDPGRPFPIVRLGVSAGADAIAGASSGAEGRPPPDSRMGALPASPPNGAGGFGVGSLNPPAEGALPSKNPQPLAASATEPAPEAGALVVNAEVVRRGIVVACGLVP